MLFALDLVVKLRRQEMWVDRRWKCNNKSHSEQNKFHSEHNQDQTHLNTYITTPPTLLKPVWRRLYSAAISGSSQGHYVGVLYTIYIIVHSTIIHLRAGLQ